MNKIPASLRSDSSDCRFARTACRFASESVPISSEYAFGNDTERINDFALAGMGPVGLYYFFSPSDESAGKDVAVLNKIWREGRLGVVGIPVGGKYEDVGSFVNEAKPLFPVRRSDSEVKHVKPTETPNLYLAFPLEKKLFRLGPDINETAITQAIANVLAAETPKNAP